MAKLKYVGVDPTVNVRTQKGGEKESIKKGETFEIHDHLAETLCRVYPSMFEVVQGDFKKGKKVTVLAKRV